MQVEATGDGAGIPTKSAEVRPLIDTFAVIHDEPYLSIVYDNGVFKGTVVEGTLDRLEHARQVAARYGLAIHHLRMDNYGSYDIRLREVHDRN